MSNINRRIKAYHLKTSFQEDDIVFYNIKTDPFTVYGLYDYKNQNQYCRLPEDVAKATSAGVADLSKNTAGGRLRFSTNSRYIIVKSEIPKVCYFDHMPLTGSTGMDVYIDGEGGSCYIQTIRPGIAVKDGYESILRFDSNQMRYFTINFPLYNPVNEIYIGVQQSASVCAGREYLNKKPIVFYGSSITQGACASRPGLSYENILSRRYNLDYINLGFAGNAKAELPIVEYMASLDMLAFVSDYDHNAPNVQHLRDTHSRMYDIIRSSNPDVPYIMISRPDFFKGYNDNIERRNVIIDTYRRARAYGDKNVYYIDGEGFFKGPDADSCTVDGTHPNDLGFMKMADTIGKVLERALENFKIGDEEA